MEEKSKINTDKGEEALSILAFLNTNLATASAISTVLATLFAGSFLSGYMSNFGYSIFLIFESSDFFKIILISGAIIFGFALTFYNLYLLQRTVIKYIKDKGGSYPTFAFLIATSAFCVFFYYSKSYYLSSLNFFLSLFVGLSIFIEDLIISFKSSKFSFDKLLITILIFGSYLWASGAAAGRYVREAGAFVQVEYRQGTNYFETIDEAKMVMLLSHHLILYKENKTIILPMSDISKITSANK